MIFDLKAVVLALVSISLAVDGVAAIPRSFPKAASRGRGKVSTRDADPLQKAQQDVTDMTTTSIQLLQAINSVLGNSARANGGLSSTTDESSSDPGLLTAQFSFQNTQDSMNALNNIAGKLQDQFATLESDLADAGLGSGNPDSSDDSSDDSSQCDHSSSNPCPNDG